MTATAQPATGWNPAQKKKVARILGDWNWLVQHQALLSYRSYRPWQGPKRWPRPTHPWENDCTGTILEVNCDWNGIPPWDGEDMHFGNTQTFADAIAKGLVYQVPSLAHVQPLDICLYNHGGPFVGGSHEHATQITHQHGGVWYAASMGQDSDPSYVQASAEPTYGAPRLILRFPIPAK